MTDKFNKNIDNNSVININKKVINTIKQLMLSQKITQQSLSERSGIAQSTLSKLLRGDANFSLNQLVQLSNALRNNIFNTIASSDFNNIVSSASNSILELTENDNIILNTDRPAFRGYLNTNYFTYFFSTVSGVREIIKGRISFSETASKRCCVEFTISTGKKDIQNNDIFKKYTGCMLISIPLSTCYCISKNEEIGELSFLNFQHMFILNESMRCRVCSVLTTSSGEPRRPTTNRMILSDYEFNLDDPNDKNFLFGQLKMNNKKILITKNDFLHIIEDKKEYSKIFSSESSDIESDILSIDENLILASSLDLNKKIAFINELRTSSLADNKNKISTNTDEYLFSYIKNKNIQ